MDSLQRSPSTLVKASVAPPHAVCRHTWPATCTGRVSFGRRQDLGVAPEICPDYRRQVRRIVLAPSSSSQLAAVIACLSSSVHQRARVGCMPTEARRSTEKPCLFILKSPARKPEAGNKGHGRTRRSVGVARRKDDLPGPRNVFAVKFPCGNMGRDSRHNSANTSTLPV